MAKTTANFRAFREICGITQMQAANALGVGISTIKRWERGLLPVPADAVEWIMKCMRAHDDGVKDTVGRVKASMGRDSEACLEYYRTQEQADGGTPGSASPYGFLNAIARSAAEALVIDGYKVSFTYPDEERIYTKVVK